MHAVRRFRHCCAASALLDLPESLVGRKLPLHIDGVRRHPTEPVLGQRTGSQPGP
jgi:hypothetical protein